jgi:hypothetical protein
MLHTLYKNVEGVHLGHFETLKRTLHLKKTAMGSQLDSFHPLAVLAL